MNRDELITKLEFYYKQKISVHIDTNENKYYNGLIIEFSDKLIILLDRIIGEVPITISEIRNLEKFKGVV